VETPNFAAIAFPASPLASAWAIPAFCSAVSLLRVFGSGDAVGFAVLAMFDTPCAADNIRSVDFVHMALSSGLF
jgi:hypothetical protein